MRAGSSSLKNDIALEGGSRVGLQFAAAAQKVGFIGFCWEGVRVYPYSCEQASLGPRLCVMERRRWKDEAGHGASVEDSCPCWGCNANDARVTVDGRRDRLIDAHAQKTTSMRRTMERAWVLAAAFWGEIERRKGVVRGRWFLKKTLE